MPLAICSLLKLPIGEVCSFGYDLKQNLLPSCLRALRVQAVRFGTNKSLGAHSALSVETGVAVLGFGIPAWESPSNWIPFSCYVLKFRKEEYRIYPVYICHLS